MSIYSFGKVITRVHSESAGRVLESNASEAGIAVTFGPLDSIDNEIFEESSVLDHPGIVFNIFTPMDSDVGLIWKETSEAGLRAMQDLYGDTKRFMTWEQIKTFVLPEEVKIAMVRSRFGRFISKLFNIVDAEAVGFAIFDAGVDEILEDTPESCYSNILKTFLVPWDSGPNALFVWRCSRSSL